MKNLFALSAAPMPNPGMLAVEQALFAALRALGQPVPQLFSVEPANPEAARRKALPRTVIGTADDLAEAEAIILWGDFLHSWSYHIQDIAPRLIRAGLATDRVTALDRSIPTLFLSPLPDSVLDRVIVFGGTLLGDPPFAMTTPAYRQAFQRLFSGARLTMMRDPISATEVAIRLGQPVPACHGIDAAMLNAAPQLRTDPQNQPSRSSPATLGVFFGRTSLPAKPIVSLINKLAERLGASPEWLPWLPYRRPSAAAIRPYHDNLPVLRSAGLALADIADWQDLGEALDAVRGHCAILTDTYHLAVIAWTYGIPAILIGQGAGHAASTLADKKKEVFCWSIGASALYVFAETISAADPGAIKTVVNAASHPDLVDQISATVQRQAQHAFGQLGEVVADLAN